jgi:predicted ester cyclase
MSTQADHKAVVRQYFEEVYNGHNDALLHDLFHADFREYMHPGKGPQLARHVVDYERSVFPDIHFTVEDMLAEDEDVIARLTIRGTHQGEFQGIAPTGRKVEFTGIQRMRFKGGQIVRVVWHHYDKLLMLQQLGVVSLPPQVIGASTAVTG